MLCSSRATISAFMDRLWALAALAISSRIPSGMRTMNLEASSDGKFFLLISCILVAIRYKKNNSDSTQVA